MLSAKVTPRESMLGRRNVRLSPPPPFFPLRTKGSGLGKGSASKGTLGEQYAEIRRRHAAIIASARKNKLGGTTKVIGSKRSLFQSHLRNKENVGPKYHSSSIKTNDTVKSVAGKPLGLSSFNINKIIQPPKLLTSVSSKRFTCFRTSETPAIDILKAQKTRYECLKKHHILFDIQDETAGASSETSYSLELNKEFEKSKIGDSQYFLRSCSERNDLACQGRTDIKPQEKQNLNNRDKPNVKLSDGTLPSTNCTAKTTNKSRLPVFKVNTSRNFQEPLFGLKTMSRKKGKSERDSLLLKSSNLKRNALTTMKPGSSTNACSMDLVKPEGQSSIDICRSDTEQKLWEKNNQELKASSNVNNVFCTGNLSDRNFNVVSLSDEHFSNDVVLPRSCNTVTKCVNYCKTATQNDILDIETEDRSSISVAIQTGSMEMEKCNVSEVLSRIKSELKKGKAKTISDYEEIKAKTISDYEEIKAKTISDYEEIQAKTISDYEEIQAKTISDYDKIIRMISDRESKLVFSNIIGIDGEDDVRTSEQTPRRSSRIAGRSSNVMSGCVTLLQTPNNTDSDEESGRVDYSSTKSHRNLRRKSLGKYKEMKSNFKFLKTPQTNGVSRKNKVSRTPLTTPATLVSNKVQAQLHLLYD